MVVAKVLSPYHSVQICQKISWRSGVLIIRTSSVPQFLIDQYHCVIAWNRALEQLTGIKYEEILGTSQHGKAFYGVTRPCLADLLVDESFGDMTLWYRDKYRESAGADNAYEATDFFPYMGNGGKWLHVTAVPVRDSNGTVIGTVESFEDLTERTLLERALKLSNQKLNLMNGVAYHEIENKITSVRGYVELSRKSVKDEMAIKCFEAEETILKQIPELLHYTMDYQKIGTQPLRWVNVAGAVRSILSLMEISLLRMDLDVDALELFGDPTLEMMFSYLINNTLKQAKTAPEIRISFAEIPKVSGLCMRTTVPAFLTQENTPSLKKPLSKPTIFARSLSMISSNTPA